MMLLYAYDGCEMYDGMHGGWFRMLMCYACSLLIYDDVLRLMMHDDVARCVAVYDGDVCCMLCYVVVCRVMYAYVYWYMLYDVRRVMVYDGVRWSMLVHYV